MATPGTKFGSKESALVNLGLAADIIEQSLPALGSETEEGQKALAALRALSGLIGSRQQEVDGLKPAQLQQLMSALPKGLRPGGAQPAGPGAPPMTLPAGGAPAGGPMPGQPPGMTM